MIPNLPMASKRGSQFPVPSSGAIPKTQNRKPLVSTSTMPALRGQVATEFFVYSAVFLIIVLAAYFSIFFVQSAEVANKEALYVKWFGERFASNLNTAMSSGEGFSMKMAFSPYILEKPYSVYIKPARAGRNGFVFITWSAGNVTYSYPIGNMNIGAGDSCVHAISSPDGAYYEITSARGELWFENDGSSITITQGCT